MSKSIYKYEILPSISQPLHIINLPVGSDILNVDFQCNKIYLWAVVPVQEERKISVNIYIFPTGAAVPDTYFNNKTFFKTIFGNDLVFHVFFDKYII